MQCIHVVKIKPRFDEEEYVDSVAPHHAWLKQNGITRFRGGGFPRTPDQYTGYITFRFAESEDAVAFKLRWA